MTVKNTKEQNEQLNVMILNDMQDMVEKSKAELKKAYEELSEVKREKSALEAELYTERKRSDCFNDKTIIISKIGKIGALIGKVLKGGTIETSTRKYKVVEWQDIVEMVKDAMDEHKVILETTYHKPGGGNFSFKESNGVIDLMAKHTFIDTESGQRYSPDGFYPCFAQGNDMKVFGAATSYEIKYFYMRMFNISVSDVEDIDTMPERGKTVTRGNPKNTVREAPKKQPPSEHKGEPVKTQQKGPDAIIGESERKNWMAQCGKAGINQKNYKEYLGMIRDIDSSKLITNRMYSDDCEMFNLNDPDAFETLKSIFVMLASGLNVKYPEVWKYLKENFEISGVSDIVKQKECVMDVIAGLAEKKGE